jgi:hypothetical protein
MNVQAKRMIGIVKGVLLSTPSNKSGTYGEMLYKGSGILGNLFKVQGTITCNTRYPIVPTW